MAKKILLTSAMVAGFAAAAVAGGPAASGPKVTLGGMIDSAVGHVSNASKFEKSVI